MTANGVAGVLCGRSPDWLPEHSRSLAALMGAGLSPLQAVEVLRRQYPALSQPLEHAMSRLSRGRSLSQSLGEGGFFGRHARILLEAGEFGGRLPEALRLIADRSEQHRRRLARFRARLWLPLLLLLIATLAGLLLNTRFYQLSLGVALADAGMSLGFVFLLTTLLLKLLKLDRSGWLYWGWRLGLGRTGLYRGFFEVGFYGLLSGMLDAGCDYVEALEHCRDLLDDRVYRGRVRIAQQALASGQDPSTALECAGLPLSPALRQLIRSAGAAGRLPQALGHHLRLEQQRLDLYLEAFYEWLPRIYYLLVIGIGLRYLLG
ncbi:type II secretion system F family protein [Marinobacterium aestuariivivens]|uniref:Type II secretion system F family protein n=1 Tax=Marinobacterium aestuariivivens TaxID=1698799 RepID=A0ABW2A6T3_9GAMM